LKHFRSLTFHRYFRSEVAKACIQNGASIINDISAGNLTKDVCFIAEYEVPYIMMHMRGTLQTMQSMTHYDDIVKEMLFYFQRNKGKEFRYQRFDY
jgi:dihydropteroate synthase